ncbi:hypothetical protein mru_2071 [Methanobrevibacter ruminantium M1]|uniref:Uncharacterized protein n=1 Tax=Methanobrevibacter ruminantium (strain ATCC 35063 / DSM 1093 / JCM 13430 / OCM 146 / M1) TaxID=634498 RepID=D3E0U7_METRM|nr:hypothetical protein [Methanobrevibacter ruminantium]ADC47921.1 hypothetical protein mru_2071 [Methanobrevibacter ruminantium M1]
MFVEEIPEEKFYSNRIRDEFIEEVVEKIENNILQNKYRKYLDY